MSSVLELTHQLKAMHLSIYVHDNIRLCRIK